MAMRLFYISSELKIIQTRNTTLHNQTCIRCTSDEFTKLL